MISGSVYPLEVIDTLAKRIRKSNDLVRMHQQLSERLNYPITYGAEIEFYITDNNIPHGEKLCGYSLKKEKGQQQYEVCFPYTDSPFVLAGAIRQFKEDVEQYLGDRGSFAAKPYQDDYGSAMHIHIDVGVCNMDWAADALCYYLQKSFIAFAPSTDSYQRFDAQFMAPTHIAYGNNNRSCALRVPSSEPKRIEHRVAGVDSDPYLVLFSILQSLLLARHLETLPKQQKIYGNAFDEQYNLPRLPSSLEHALQLMEFEFFTNNHHRQCSKKP